MFKLKYLSYMLIDNIVQVDNFSKQFLFSIKAIVSEKL